MLDPMMSEIFVATLTALAGGGGAFIGLKTSINDTRKRVERIESTTDRIWEKVNDTNSRLGILEVRHEFTKDQVEDLENAFRSRNR